MAAEADGALHVALHGDVDAFGRDAAVLQFSNGETHHNLGAADEGDRLGRIEDSARDEGGDEADVAPPAYAGGVDGDLDF